MSFFIGDKFIGVEDSAIVFEELSGDLLAAGHLEVENLAHARRAALPKATRSSGFFLMEVHGCRVFRKCSRNAT